VQGIAGDKNAIGYFGLAYYEENKGKLKVVPVVNPSGKEITPSLQTVMDGTYAPLSRPLFIYVNKRAAAEKPEVKELVDFYLKNAQALQSRSSTFRFRQTPTSLQPRGLPTEDRQHVGGEEKVGMRSRSCSA